MTSLLVFPDAEQITTDYLRAGITAVSGYSGVVGHIRLPSPLPDRFFQVRRIGGVRDSIVADNPRLDLFSWGNSDTDAHDMAQLLRSLMYAMRGSTHEGTFVYNVTEFAGIQAIPDPDTGRSRYLQSFEVRLRGTQT